jgi:hypothetical protein
MIARSVLGMALVAGALAGCTPMQWQNTALGTAPTSAERGFCDRSAYHEAYRYALYDDFSLRPRYYLGRDGRHYPIPSYPSPYQDRFFVERRLFDDCMQAIGYQLVPARPADRSG